MQPKNYYSILGVTEKATHDEIRRAYRELAKKLHPDKNPGNKKAEEAFKEVQDAYSTLSDPIKRSKYDFLLKYGARQEQSSNASSQQQRKTYNYTHRTRSRSGSNGNINPVTVMMSLTAVIVFVYFSVSNFRSSNAEPGPMQMPTVLDTSFTIQPAETYTISSADSPYDPVFGPAVYDTSSRNSVYLYNSGYCEAIVCIAEAKASSRTIRNEYIGKGVKFKLDGIPDGVYYAKVYYGNKWDPSKKMDRATGGFNEELGFVFYNNKNMLFDMRQKRTGSVITFSSYQLTLDPRDTTGTVMLTAEQFFH